MILKQSFMLNVKIEKAIEDVIFIRENGNHSFKKGIPLRFPIISISS